MKAMRITGIIVLVIGIVVFVLSIMAATWKDMLLKRINPLLNEAVFSRVNIKCA